MALDALRILGFTLLFQALFWATHLVSRHTMLARKYDKFSSYDRNQWCQFVCSFVKGVAICSLCFPIALRNAEAFWNVASFDGALNQTDMELPLYIYSGYAVSDLVSILTHFERGKGDEAMIIHHTATAGIWCYILALDFAYQFACIACLVECTTPLLALRWFMSSSRLKTHAIYMLNGLLILVGWWVFRIFVFVVFFGWKVTTVFHEIIVPRNVPVVIAWAIGVVLQIFWCHKLTIGFIKVVRNSFKKE